MQFLDDITSPQGDKYITAKDIVATEGSLIEKPIPLGVTKLLDIREVGIYQIYDANIKFTDYPTFLTNTGHIYGILTVKVANNYIEQTLKVCQGSTTDFREAICFINGSANTGWTFAGNGCNASTLAGKYPSDFFPYYNMSGQTIDLNTFINQGLYNSCQAGMTTNAPEDAWGSVYVSWISNSFWVQQLWMGQNGNIFSRRSVQGSSFDTVWQPWQQIITSATIGTQSVSNADMLDGYHATDFPIRVGNILSTDDLNNANFHISYEAATSNGIGIGLPSDWWHIKYFKHASNDGYGAQLAISLNNGNLMYLRTSTGTSWFPWVKILTSDTIGTGSKIGSIQTTGCIANGNYSFATGEGCIAGLNNAHVEGQFTLASSYDHVIVVTSVDIANKTIKVVSANLFPQLTVGSDIYLQDRGRYPNFVKCKVTGTDSANLTIYVETLNLSNPDIKYLYCPNTINRTLSVGSHAEGEMSIAVGRGAHSEGVYSEAVGASAHAEGASTQAIANSAHSEGELTEASGSCSHAEGSMTKASGYYSHSEGYETIASGYYSHASGYGTHAIGTAQTVIGKHNISDYNFNTNAFVVGNGQGETGTGTGDKRSNAFRVSGLGQVYSKGAYNTSGADYAELFEWEDGNINNEDRRGLFVALRNNKIALPDKKDDYIIGVISSNPSLIGNNPSETWKNMYLTDIWGDIIMENKLIPAKYKTINEEQILITEEYYEDVPVINPEYNPSKKYIQRNNRKEWGTVGLLGQLTVKDDNTCEVGKYCTANIDGTATISNTKTNYYVMQRIQDNFIKILILR